MPHLDKETGDVTEVSHTIVESDTGRKLKAKHYNGFDAEDDDEAFSTGVSSEDFIFFSGSDVG